jgi:ribonuclease T1
VQAEPAAIEASSEASRLAVQQGAGGDSVAMPPMASGTPPPVAAPGQGTVAGEGPAAAPQGSPMTVTEGLGIDKVWTPAHETKPFAVPGPTIPDDEDLVRDEWLPIAENAGPPTLPGPQIKIEKPWTESYPAGDEDANKPITLEMVRHGPRAGRRGGRAQQGSEPERVVALDWKKPVSFAGSKEPLIRPLKNVAILDAKTLERIDLTEELERIVAGKRYGEGDGTVHLNKDKHFPRRPNGYYREYYVRTPGRTSYGNRRIIIGNGGETWYYNRHYNDDPIRLDIIE